ncbi:MAG: hypothetical protein M3Q70_01780 [bacterium]|nr:hypothetical protein [bacterium]
MKKLIMSMVLVTIVITSSSAFAVTGEDVGQAEPPKWSSYSALNDILIPDEILFAIQVEYTGFSATRAEKLNRNGVEGYKLFIDKSDVSVGREGFYLFFDNNWKFIDRGELPALAPVFQPESKPTTESEPQPTEVEDTSEETEPEEAEPVEDNEEIPAPVPEESPAPPKPDPVDENPSQN